MEKEKYTVGKLIYDANVYDGMNTFMDDFDFYKKWTTSNKNLKVLELCCGTGHLTILLAREGVKITGIDFTITMLDEAKANLYLSKGLTIENLFNIGFKVIRTF